MSHQRHVLPNVIWFGISSWSSRRHHCCTWNVLQCATRISTAKKKHEEIFIPTSNAFVHTSKWKWIEPFVSAQMCCSPFAFVAVGFIYSHPHRHLQSPNWIAAFGVCVCVVCGVVAVRVSWAAHMHRDWQESGANATLHTYWGERWRRTFPFQWFMVDI